MTKARHQQRLKYGRDRRAAFIAARLRSDGVPRIGPKPCGCLFGSCLECAKTTNSLILKPALVKAMWADYEAGMSLMGVARKYGKHRKSLNQVFARRGYKLRPVATVPKLGFGVKIPEPSLKEMKAMIAGLSRMNVPPELKLHWRKWSLARRRWFIQLLRERFPSNRPAGPFSRNVIPFEYGTPLAHEIANKMNVGRTSQTKLIAFKLTSEGVIYRGKIYFWDHNDSYVQGTRWTPEKGRPLLTHIMWEDSTGQPVPYRTMVIQKDGNKNNFEPGNLELITMADNAIRNKTAGKIRKGDIGTRALLDRFNRGGGSEIFGAHGPAVGGKSGEYPMTTSKP
jgi:hypothetical protein